MKKLFRQAAVGISLFVAALFLPSLITSAAVHVVEPTSQFYVADYADVLDPNTENTIVAQNDTLYAKTGAQVVVVTVDFLNGADIQDYAVTLFNQWEIGSAEKNNGVLLLLAIGEDDYFALQGSGIESQLTSGELGDILAEYLEPDFAEKNYDTGVSSTFAQLVQRVNTIYAGTTTGGNQDYQPGGTTAYSPSPSFSFLSVIGVILALAVIVLMIVLIGRRRRFYGGPVAPPPYYPPPRHHFFHRPPPPPGGFRPPPRPRGGFGGFSGFGGGRSSGGGISRGGFGSRSGGGGASRGGGARRR